MHVITVPDNRIEYVSLRAALRSGAAQDPAGREGLANIVAQMLTRGTKRCSRAQLTDEMDYLGTSINAAASNEHTEISFDCARPRLAELTALLKEILASSEFGEDELDKVRRQTIAEIAEIRDTDAAVASILFAQLVFRRRPYAHPIRGFAHSVNAISREDVVRFFHDLLGTSERIVGAAGDVDERILAETLLPALEGLSPMPRHPNEVADPSRGPTSLLDHRPSTIDPSASLGTGHRPSAIQGATEPSGLRSPGLKILLVTKPDRSQAQVVIGQEAIRGSDPLVFPLGVAITAFGGTFTSPLVREIREKRGWSYGVSATVMPGAKTGLFSMRFSPATGDAVPAVSLALEMLSSLVADGLPRKDFDFCVRFLVSQYPFLFDTAARKMDLKFANRLNGRPDDYIETYLDTLHGLGIEKCNEAVASVIDPKSMFVVVLGAPSLAEPLSKLPGVAEMQVLPHTWDDYVPDAT